MRQEKILREYDPPRGISVSALSYEYPPGYRVPDHAHGSDQLIYAIEGTMEVSSGSNVWTLPPQFALWLPARTSHWIQMTGAVRMRTLYFRPGAVSRRPPGCSLLYVAPLLRELIIEAVRLGRLRQRNPPECALRDLLARQLAIATAAHIGITMPLEPRALSVAQLIAGKLTDRRPLAKLCAEAGVGVRTAQRIFRKELGCEIDTWRRQARLTRAVQLLVAGHSVKEVSFRVGYKQSSAFVEAFRRLFGSTPKVWTAGLRRAEGE
ncbi:MAG: helix-turn-helix transcriptional regulator [Terracidiphilus sp.]|jgi:AraC-like DNA-binding protein/quercetin dioxygenase-like cupin family protein